MGLFDRIANWFGDIIERKAIVQRFNKQSNQAWDEGFPFMLRAEITKGDSRNSHTFSRWNSGFRIKALTGGDMDRDKCTMVAMVILSNQSLVRQLIRSGFDTLEVYGGDVGFAAPLKELLIS
jgi:hypothetical protein